MRQYRNKRTGAVIEAACEVAGGDWAEIRPFPAKAARTAPEGAQAGPVPEAAPKAKKAVPKAKKA